MSNLLIIHKGHNWITQELNFFYVTVPYVFLKHYVFRELEFPTTSKCYIDLKNKSGKSSIPDIKKMKHEQLSNDVWHLRMTFV